MILRVLQCVVVFSSLACLSGEVEDIFPGDFLTPYKEHYRTKRFHRHVRDCQPVKFGSTTFEVANVSRELNHGTSFSHIQNIFYKFNLSGPGKTVVGHFATVKDPMRTFSVLEPGKIGGCSKFTRATVAESARQRKCYIAANAGFFRTKDGMCYGNVFSDGRKVLDSGGVQNANFGIRKSGTIVVGYLSEEDVLQSNDPFIQLVSGVVWIVRNGTIYVNESKKAECRDTEETGPMDKFASVMSARTALGHDKQGRVVIVQMDGKTSHSGIDLYNFGKLLLKYGIVNAINLDGGGSATMVVNESLVNYPSDECGDFICPRKVSTIVCAHEPDCDPKDCNGHGLCEMGQCYCDEQWTGQSCDILLCRENNCSSNGLCSAEGGCLCFPGWKGINCSEVCPNGFYGLDCSELCACQNGATCDPRNGICNCTVGWSGKFCEQRCPPGSYGRNCSKICNCSKSCACSAATGECTEDKQSIITLNSTQQWVQCMMDSKMKQLSGPVNPPNNMKSKDMERQYSELFVWFVTITSLCAISLLANLFLVYLACNKATRRTFRRLRSHEGGLLSTPNDDDDDEDEL